MFQVIRLYDTGYYTQYEKVRNYKSLAKAVAKMKEFSYAYVKNLSNGDVVTDTIQYKG